MKGYLELLTHYCERKTDQIFRCPICFQPISQFGSHLSHLFHEVNKFKLKLQLSVSRLWKLRGSGNECLKDEGVSTARTTSFSPQVCCNSEGLTQNCFWWVIVASWSWLYCPSLSEYNHVSKNCHLSWRKRQICPQRCCLIIVKANYRRSFISHSCPCIMYLKHNYIFYNFVLWSYLLKIARGSTSY